MRRWFGTTASLFSNSSSLLAAAQSLGFVNASELKHLNAAHIIANVWTSCLHLLVSVTLCLLIFKFTQALATPAAKGGMDICLLHLRSPDSQSERERNIHLLDELASHLASSAWLTCIVTSYAAGMREEEKPVPPLHSLRPAQVRCYLD